MVPFSYSGSDTHLVHSKALDCDKLFVVVEELGFHGRVRHEDVHEDGCHYGEQTAEEENDLIGV